MITILVLIGVFFGVVLFFCRNLRQSVMNRLTAAGYYAAGAWNNITDSVSGTDWRIVRNILWVVLAALILPLLLALFFVILLSLGITTLGLVTGSVWVSIPFGIAFVIWFIFYQIPRALNRLPVYGRMIRLTCWIAGLIALVCFVPLAMGIVMPDVKSGLIRRAWNEQKQAGNNLNEGSAHSEPEVGIIRKLKEDIYGIPDIPGKEPFFMGAGGEVKVLSWDTNRKANDQREGLVKVMAKNKFGHFNGGPEGWVPTRVLEEGPPSASSHPSPPEGKAGEKKEGGKFSYLDPQTGQKVEFPAKIDRSPEKIRAEVQTRLGIFVHEGVSSDGVSYTGKWSSPNMVRGEFEYKFSDGPCGEGWHEQGGQRFATTLCEEKK